MKKWYKEPYFNIKEWLIANYDKLNITNNELVFLLLIIYARDNHILINNEYFVSKMHLKSKEIDSIVSSLVSKGYLKIEVENKGIYFNIDGVFEFDPDKFTIIDNKDIYDLFADVFARPLNTIELQKLSDLIELYGENNVDHALRIAESYNKININYIESILKNNENKK